LKIGCSEDQPLVKGCKMIIMGAMYLRCATRKKGDVDYDYWLLVESVRTARGPRHRVVATIGKLSGIDQEERIGWEEIGRILSGQPCPAPDLFERWEAPPSCASDERLKGSAMFTWDCFYGTSLAMRASAEFIFLHVEKRFHGRLRRLFWLLHAFVLRLRNRRLLSFGTERLHWKTCWVFPKTRSTTRSALPCSGCSASSQGRLMPSSANALRRVVRQHL
jgi:hypothetical protein